MFLFSIATLLLLSSFVCAEPTDKQKDYSNYQIPHSTNGYMTSPAGYSAGGSKPSSSVLPTYTSPDAELDKQNSAQPIIKRIILEGNKLVPDQAIRTKIPYHVNKPFDPALSRTLIRNVYALGYFNAIDVSTTDNDDGTIDLYVTVHEKPKVESITYIGAHQITPTEIEKKLKLSEISTMDQHEAELYAEKIKKMYAEKNYHHVDIKTTLEPTPRDTVIVTYTITEGPMSVVKRVNFTGNTVFSRKKLASLIFTREDWLLGFMNKAGSYQPEALEYDKHMLETYYQNHGYLAAKVTDVSIENLDDPGNLSVTFHIDEGDKYTIKSVSAPGNKLLTEEQIKAIIPIKPGQLYNRDLIKDSIETLQTTWGQFGYIYADVDPELIPDFENKTVTITFHTDLGEPVTLRRVNIIGNIKTRDYVIRRKLEVEEGQVLTTQAMERSKSEVEQLGFFDPKTGVTWRTTKISEGLVDLDLIVEEVKTGRIYAQVGYGGNEPNTPNSSVNVTLGVTERNFKGTGIMTNLNLSFSKQNRSAQLSIMQPWLFNYPIGSGFDFYHRKNSYEDFQADAIPVSTTTGGTAILNVAPWTNPAGLPFIGNLGYDKIEWVQRPFSGKTLLNAFYERRFQSGKMLWLALNSGIDARNNPVMPTRGHSWNMASKVAIPSGVSQFGFYKLDFDATWLTPIIGESKLIFLLHGHAGLVESINNSPIPYNELYHVGGLGTVRGFTYGQIGPQFMGNSLGGKKAFWVNAELIFSVTEDRSIRGVLFYDGGAGWDTVIDQSFSNLLLDREQRNQFINNNFKYRHAVGFGIRLTQPSPLRVDWGFKLDRNKRLGEKIMEVHFTMMQDF